MSFNGTNTPSAKERSKALDLALQQIEKAFGKGAIMTLGEGNAAPGIEIEGWAHVGQTLNRDPSIDT